MSTDITPPGRSPAECKSSFDIHYERVYSPDTRLTINLIIVARRWRALLDERLRTIGQSAARMEALGAIKNSPTLSAQVNIAKRLRIEGPTMTRMLDTLESDGLVERLPDPHDRRTKQLRLTPEGETTLEAILEISNELRGRLLKEVPDDTIAELNEFLGMLTKRLDAGLPAAS